MVSGVKILLDKERTLRFDFNAMRSYEKATGHNMLSKGIRDHLKEINVDGMTTLLWAALVHEDKDLTVDAVGAMLSLGDAGRVFGALTEAFVEAMPKVEEPADPTPAPTTSPPKKSKTSTG